MSFIHSEKENSRNCPPLIVKINYSNYNMYNVKNAYINCKRKSFIISVSADDTNILNSDEENIGNNVPMEELNGKVYLSICQLYV